MSKKKKKKRPRHKTQSLKIHFKKRVWERLRFWVSKKDINNIKEYVKKGEHEKNIVFLQSNRVIGFKYIINKTEIVLLWDKIRQTPITILPKYWLEKRFVQHINKKGIIDIRGENKVKTLEEIGI